MCACRKVAGASPGSSVMGRGCPVARCVEAGTFSALPRAPLCERYYNVTRATACFVARFCRPWGWGGVVRRAGAVFPTSGVVGQPRRGKAAGCPVRPLGVAVVLGSVARTPDGAAGAEASVGLPPRRPRSSSQVCELPLGIAKRTRSQSVLARALATHYFKPAVLCEPLACIRSCIGSATIAVLAAHCSQRKRRA